MMLSLRFGLVAFMVLITRGDASWVDRAGWKPTSQSTLFLDAVSGRAVDGNFDDNFEGNSCSATNRGPDAWWAVDLQGLYEVGYVVIYNRQDCCGEILTNFDVMVGNDAPNYTAMELCHHHARPTGDILEVACIPPIQGRQVLIRLLSADMLVLCEVQVFGDAVPESIANGKPTSQSTLFLDGVSARAVDGNTDGNYEGNSCTSTNKGPSSWWTVDLQELYEVTSVKIYNRQDCCGEGLQNFDIMVGNNASNPAAMELCHHQQSPVGAMLEISCTYPIQGRHVLIRLLTTGGMLVLCEVEVFAVAVPESIANEKRTSQSTLYKDGYSNRAVDGNTDGNWGANSCMATNGPDSWWAVDLKGLYEVTSVKIYNRQDCCGEILQNVDIMVGNDTSNPAEMELCHHQQSAVGAMLEISCTNPIQGRHVLIRLLTGNILILCEVEVFGDVVPESIANGKPTSQSTLYAGGASERAVDGNTDGNWGANSCTATNGPDSWWAVDLQGLYKVTSVKIYNRQDCCGEILQNVDIMVGNDASNPAKMELCHHQQSPVGPMLEISCTHPIQGRHVLIRLLTGNILTLCEVKVFGVPSP